MFFTLAPLKPLASLNPSMRPVRCRVVAWVCVLTLAVVTVSWAQPAPDSKGSESPAYAHIDIDGIGHGPLTELQRDPRLRWWVELDDQLLVLAARNDLEAMSSQRSVRVLDVPVRTGDLYTIRRGHQDQLLSGAFDVLAQGGRFSIVQSPGGKPTLESFHDDHDLLSHGADHGAALAHEREKSLHAMVLPFLPRVTLARQQANRRGAEAAGLKATLQQRYGQNATLQAQQLVDAVDPARWFAAVEVLAGFNRYTHSPELLQARDWLVQQFSALPGLAVTTQEFSVGSTLAYNVLATHTGTVRPDAWHIIGAHYDSISENPSSAAPGAEDNASGCAGVLEMARIFSAAPPEETVIFMCYSGEELGLIGSDLHAQGIVDDGDASKVQTMLNMDMIGYSGDADLDCLLETDTAFASLLDPFADAAAAYTNLRIVTSLFAFGSDHVPYLNRNMPALLTIENDWNVYPDYHRTGDVASNLSLDMGGETLRMNVGAMALRIGATVDDGSVVFRDGFEAGDLSAWSGAQP